MRVLPGRQKRAPEYDSRTVGTEVMDRKPALSAGLLNELQDAISHGNVARRVEYLRRVTDLFLNAPTSYSDEQIALFDDVFHCLIGKIETSAKALLASRLAPIPKAPPQLMHTLAFDDAIEVAAPVLSQSERLDDAALIRTARVKSQGHLLAISKRKALSHSVTDILVERGNADVVESTVNNPGAQFSDNTFDTLVAKAADDDNLASCLGARPSIPRHHYLKLVAKASATVRARLQRGDPDCAEEVTDAVREIARRAGSVRSEETIRVQGLVQSLYDEGRLNEEQVAEFAEDDRFEETSAALAVLANIAIVTVENIMLETQSEGLLVLAKVAGLSWATLEKVLTMSRTLVQADAATGIDDYRNSYAMLRVATAQQVLRFYRMQQATEHPVPTP